MTVTQGLEALGGLGAVSLIDLIAVADLQTRRDRKYIVPRSLVDQLVTDSHPDTRVLTIDDRRSFRYESVYFDTTELTSYLGAARRRPARFKVRTRSYLDAGHCVLEVKVRDARGRTVKHRQPYDIDRRARLDDDARRFLALVEQSAAVADRLDPILTTTYRRATLLLPDTEARITIDVDLAWHHADGRSAELPHIALVETKTAGQPCPFDRALWSHGQRPTTISKYCTGLAALDDALPANKWNRVLRRHFDRIPARTT